MKCLKTVAGRETPSRVRNWALVCCCCKVTSVVSDSVQPHRWQPTRLRRPWDSPGKNTGVGCHFLLQCMKVKSESEVAQSCPTSSDSMDCNLPGFSAHGIFQARVLEWGAIAFSGLLSNTQKWIVRGDTCADKARDFIGKGTRENCSVMWLQSWVLWWWD